MVARGDLGVELPPEDVPGIKQIVDNAEKRANPSSSPPDAGMIGAPASTGAEASDVATAVYDGADAVMLGGDRGRRYRSSRLDHGPHYRPDRTRRAYRAIMDTTIPTPNKPHPMRHRCRRAGGRNHGAAAISLIQRRVPPRCAPARQPDVPILCLTEIRATARRLARLGYSRRNHAGCPQFRRRGRQAYHVAREENLPKGERLVVTAGVPFGTPGRRISCGSRG